MWSPINLRLMSNPLNWGIVWIVLLLTALGYTFIAHHSSGSGGCGCGNSVTPD